MKVIIVGRGTVTSVPPLQNWNVEEPSRDGRIGGTFLAWGQW